jgi:hypothetical protein
MLCIELLQSDHAINYTDTKTGEYATARVLLHSTVFGPLNTLSKGANTSQKDLFLVSNQMMIGQIDGICLYTHSVPRWDLCMT